MPTGFEKRVGELRLTNDTCADSDSDEPRRWCTDNRNRCYVPEWLLKTWGILDYFFGLAVVAHD
jgi:hypothetical protein